MRIQVRAAEGRGLVEPDFVVDAKVIFALRPHVVREGAKEREVPSGVAYVMNTELRKRTNGHTHHQLVEDGLFRLLCQLQNIVLGEKLEAKVLVSREGDIRRCADFLRVSGVMTPEESEKIVDQLRVHALNLGAPKRAEEKLIAAKRLSDAAEARSKGGSAKIGPATMRAYAATSHVKARTQVADGIGKYFNPYVLAVQARIRRNQQLIEDLWKFLAKPNGNDLFEEAGTLPRRNTNDFYGLFILMNDPERGPRAKTFLRRRLDEYARSIGTIVERPYRPVTANLPFYLSHLQHLLAGSNPTAVMEQYAHIIRTLRRLRMMYYNETRLIVGLSDYLHRTKPSERMPTDRAQKEFWTRFKVADKRLRALTPDELDPVLRTKLIACYESAKLAMSNGDPEQAKEILKTASFELVNVEPEAKKTPPRFQSAG